MSLPRYPKYKDSGVEWLGEVPWHWHLDRLKRSIVSCKNGIWGDEAQEDENDMPCVRVADFNRQRLTVVLNEPTIRNVTKKERVGRVLSKGDLLLEKSGGGENQPVGCVVLYDDARPAVCSNFVARMQIAAGMDSSYWRYVHAAAYAIRLTTGSINQTSGIQNLDQDRYFNERVAFPSLEEQQTIAAFLDRETGKIDALIAEQLRLVELLAEKRQAVISHAVTKGLNPNVRMKDSGIEWLGEVPEHWEVKRLRFVAELNPSKSEVTKLDKETLVSFLPMDAIGDDGTLNLEREKPIAEVETGYTYFRDGDVTIAKITPCFENGKGAVMSGLTQGIGFGTTELIVARPIATQTISSYLHSLFTSVVFRKNGEGHMYGAGGQKRVPDDFVRNFEIAFPPIEEQQTIAAFLDTETAKFDTLTAEANRAIALLQERRSALISAAVTGKIDVRALSPSPSPMLGEGSIQEA
ncbi:MAG: restriction endonuclease subunit S [Gallionella sp.]|nr:restriction endonuclease subunit S [Gallionella sp.]